MSDWKHCYDDRWQDIITPESFSHPAKFARGLIHRIYNHALAQGWIKPGDTVLDPFGGIGLGAIDALVNGLNWVGIELEQKFVDMGAGCHCTGISKEDWARFYGRWSRFNHKDGRHWCPACLAQAGRVVDTNGQMSLFGDAHHGAAYVRNSGKIPSTQPHYYLGNLDLFNKYTQDLAKAVLLQGDSRRLIEILAQADMVLSSPPYATNDKRDYTCEQRDKSNQGKGSFRGFYGHTDGQIAKLPEGNPQAVIASPPFAGNSGGRGEASRQGIDPGLFDRHSGGMVGGMGDAPENLGNLSHGDIGAVIGSPPYSKSNQGYADGWKYIDKDKLVHNRPSSNREANYGEHPAQLANLTEGNPQAVISSPPFAGSVGSDEPEKRGGLYRDPKRKNDKNLTGTYGDSDGQLGAMTEGKVVMKSPPYEGSMNSETHGIDFTKCKPDYPGRIFHENRVALIDRRHSNRNYGSTNGQVGATTGETFWSAARLIVEQCYQVLPPGAVAIWVVKDFVRGGERVPFGAQWRQLCEACGFEHLETHRAWLVKDKGQQMTIDGGFIDLSVERKSFFRILFESKAKAAKHWETLSRNDKAQLLCSSHKIAWIDYWRRLNTKDSIQKPNRRKILASAQTEAWSRDGKLYYELDTIINFEEVICMRKPLYLI